MTHDFDDRINTERKYPEVISSFTSVESRNLAAKFISDDKETKEPTVKIETWFEFEYKGKTYVAERDTKKSDPTLAKLYYVDKKGTKHKLQAQGSTTRCLDCADKGTDVDFVVSIGDICHIFANTNSSSIRATDCDIKEIPVNIK